MRQPTQRPHQLPARSTRRGFFLRSRAEVAPNRNWLISRPLGVGSGALSLLVIVPGSGSFLPIQSRSSTIGEVPPIAAELGENATHVGAVRHFIDMARQPWEPPPIAVALSTDPRLHVNVWAPDLRDYEQLSTESTPVPQRERIVQRDFGNGWTISSRVTGTVHALEYLSAIRRDGCLEFALIANRAHALSSLESS